MNPQSIEPFLSPERIEGLIQAEPAIFTLGLLLGSAIFYKVILRGLTAQRHASLRRLFWNVFLHLLVANTLALVYLALARCFTEVPAIIRLGSYVGLACILSWSIVFIKTCRILLFEYLFLMSMRAGVPLLLVNMMTLLLTVILGGWISAAVFGVQLAPLLATSAIFSLVLGLALQDTLGNLFAGIAIQFDKPYAIGDWIEVTVNDIKWIGQVQEISWRATLLLSLTEELISVPNRMMGQTQISNFSAKTRPIIRSQMFRLPWNTPIAEAKRLLVEAATSVNSICQSPAPYVLITESSESWILFKLIYYIRDFGINVSIGDRVFTAGTEALRKAGIEAAPQRILILRNHEEIVQRR